MINRKFFLSKNRLNNIISKVNKKDKKVYSKILALGCLFLVIITTLTWLSDHEVNLVKETMTYRKRIAKQIFYSNNMFMVFIMSYIKYIYSLFCILIYFHIMDTLQYLKK